MILTLFYNPVLVLLVLFGAGDEWGEECECLVEQIG